MELLRFATAGSVDDGKSTLIGRLLYDTKSILEDQLEAVESASARMGLSVPNLALLTDGLRAEREQGAVGGAQRGPRHAAQGEGGQATDARGHRLGLGVQDE